MFVDNIIHFTPVLSHLGVLHPGSGGAHLAWSVSLLAA